MSIETSPVQRMFDLQRRYVEKSLENVKKSLETHKKSVKETETKTPIEVYNRNLEAGKTLGDTYFDIIEEITVEEITPQEIGIEQQKELYDEAYKEFEKSTKEAQKAYTENIENAVEFYIETLEENLEVLDEQIDLYLEGLDEMEDQTVEAVEQSKEVIEVEEK